MKKILFIFFALLSFSLYAEETILLTSNVKTDLNGYDFTSNFEIVSDSGRFKQKDLLILEPNEKGFRFMAKNVPEYYSCNYKILPSYPVFLNEPNTGSGYIENAASIKSIKVVATTNRPYDEIILLYSNSPNGEIKEIKMPQDFNKINSMEEFELIFENPMYEPDVNKRKIVSKPVLGSNIDGIYLRGIKVQTNAPSGYNAYSKYSIFYLKEISVIYDKMFTEEQIENKKILKEEFNIKETVELENKVIEKISKKNRLKDEEKKLMHKE